MDKNFAALLALNVGMVVLGVGVAEAQVTLPTVAAVGPSDLVQVLPGGSSAAGNKYVKAGAIAAVPGYLDAGIISTGTTLAYTNLIADIFAQPAGTLANVTLTTSPNPADGQKECFLSIATTTTLTVAAGSSDQTIGASVPTAGVANTRACWTYVKSASTWKRSP